MIPMLNIGAAGRNSVYNGLISYWNMQEGNGATRADSADGNSLSDTNTVDQAVGQGDFPFCAIFAGTNEYLKKASPTGLNFGNTEYSVACWANYDAVQASDVIGNFNGSKGWLLYFNSGGGGSIIFSQLDGLGAEDDLNMSGSGIGGSGQAGVWFLSIVRNDVNAATLRGRIYIVGGSTTDYTTPVTLAAVPSVTDFYVGVRAGASRFFDGKIGPCGVWNRILTTDEMDFLYNSQAGKLYPFS